MAISVFSTERLLRMVAELKPARTALLDAFFSEVETFPTESVRVDIDTRKRRMAPFVAPRAEAQSIGKRGYVTRLVTPAYVKPMVDYTPTDLFTREPGVAIHQGDNNTAASRVARDLADMQDMVTRREEWMAAQALSSGTVVVSGDGVNETVNFLLPASHNVVLAGADLWSAGTATPIEDIRTWRRLISQDSGLDADVMFMGATAADAFLDHADTQAQLDTRRIALGTFNVRQIGQDSGLTALGNIGGENGLDIFAYDEWAVPDGGGAEGPMIANARIIMGSSRARATRLYGAIQDFAASGTGPLMQARWFPKMWQSENPSVMYSMLQSSPLPSPFQINGFLTATVL